MTSEDTILSKLMDGIKRLPYWQLSLLSVLVILLAVAAFFLLRQPGRAATVTEAPAVEETQNEPAPIMVYVAGAVARPGVYTLNQGARVADALNVAGGVSPDAELSGLNLAAKLRDGEKVAIPRVGESPQTPGDASRSERHVNLNTASAAELDQVPGIGPVLAERILDYRESHGAFGAIEELKQVEGIGPKKFEDLKDKVEI